MLKKLFDKFIKKRKTKNIFDALKGNFYLRALTGTTVMVVKEDYYDPVSTDFNVTGLATFFLWLYIYWYCSKSSINNDQSILRVFFNTKLGRTGDLFEKSTAIIYFTYGILTLAFHLNSNPAVFQEFLNIDKAIRKMGITIDYSGVAFTVFISAVIQVFYIFVQALITTIMFWNSKVSIPFETSFLLAFPRVLAHLIIVCFCFKTKILKERYKILNAQLKKIAKAEENGGNHNRPRPRPDDLKNGNDAHEVQFWNMCAAEKIRVCARLYSVLYKASKTVSETYGFALLLTLIIGFTNVVLYLFYLVEAMANEQFKQTQEYTYFVTYIVWQVIGMFGAVYPVMTFSESVEYEASQTSYYAYEVINQHLNPNPVAEEASHLALQTTHEQPKFTTCGVMTLGTPLLLAGARDAVTFVMLLLKHAFK